MTRAFVSIDMPENVRNEIKKIQEHLPDFYGKKTELENLHLTLKFLGEISYDKVEEIKKRLEEIKFSKFETRVKEVGVFSEKLVRIVWLYLANCEELKKIIDESLIDLFEPEKRFMSHLTIARVKSLNNKKDFLDELKKIKIPMIKFEVDNFCLKKSVLKPEGAVYETIEEYNLS